jgi:hypothetical protein
MSIFITLKVFLERKPFEDLRGQGFRQRDQQMQEPCGRDKLGGTRNRKETSRKWTGAKVRHPSLGPSLAEATSSGLNPSNVLTLSGHV